MRVLGIDPGKTSGFALISFNEVHPFKWQECSTNEGRYSHDQFVEVINEFWPTHVVCESFVHVQRSGVDYYPIELIGLVKWLNERRRFKLDFQTPSYGKGFFGDDKLKKLGIYQRGKPHANDAFRHLLQWLMKNEYFDLNLLR